MKKSFPVNINGRIFNIDEDAFQLLQNYLDQLHATFPGSEGSEIVEDIEGRVAELFDDRVNSGANVITIADVNRVISIMGRPEDLGLGSDESETAASAKGEPTPPPFGTEQKPIHRLYRDIDDKMLGGVLSGVAMYFGWDSTPVRLLAVLLTICTAFWPCFIAYIIAWAVIPPADTTRRRLELRGEAVSVEAVGRGVLYESGAVRREHSGSNFFSALFDILAKCVMGLIGFFAGLTGLACVMGLLGILVVLIAIPFNHELYAGIIYNIHGANIYLSMVAGALVCLSVLLPNVALTWLSLNVLFGVKGCSRTMIAGAVVLEILLLVATGAMTLIFTQYIP